MTVNEIINDESVSLTGNILVVDDEPLVRTTISKYLERSGYTVTQAEHGKDALQKLSEDDYDLVITDLKMPQMDGRQLLKELAISYNDIPRIVLTAIGSDEDILLALKTGAYDFLSKPIMDFALLNHSVQRALEKKKLQDDKKKAVKQLEHINSVISLLNKGKDSSEVFDILYNSLQSIVPFNRLMLVSVYKQNNYFAMKFSKSDHKELLTREMGVEVNSELMEKLLTNRIIHIIDDLGEFSKYDKISEHVKLLIEEGMQSAAIIPLSIEKNILGYMILFSEEPSFYNTEHIGFLKMVARQIAFAVERTDLLTELEIHSRHLEQLVKARTHEVLKIQKTTIFALSKLAETRDTETGEHLERMRNYCLLMAQLVKYSGANSEVTNEFMKNLYDSSILHDIGKVGIPDNVLLKPGKLTPEEFDIIKTHTTIGYSALHDAARDLGENSFLDMAKDIAYYHHEKWDGSGYPCRIAGEQIPLAARIVAIGDVYDALSSKRPYKDPLPHNKVIDIMREDENHFDPFLLELFCDNHGDFDRIRRQFD